MWQETGVTSWDIALWWTTEVITFRWYPTFIFDLENYSSIFRRRYTLFQPDAIYVTDIYPPWSKRRESYTASPYLSHRGCRVGPRRSPQTFWELTWWQRADALPMRFKLLSYIIYALFHCTLLTLLILAVHCSRSHNHIVLQLLEL